MLRRVKMRPERGESSARMAGTAPLYAVRINGLKKMSAKESYQRCMVIMPEFTMPGSQQFTRMPRLSAFRASSSAYPVMSFFERAYVLSCPNVWRLTESAFMCRGTKMRVIEVVNTSAPPCVTCCSNALLKRIVL